MELDTAGVTMIPVNIDDIDVLRRSLEDLDSRTLPPVTVDAVVELPANADVATTVEKTNEVVKSFNRLLGQLNRTDSNIPS